MRKRAIDGRKIRISAVITATITNPRMRHDRPNAGLRRRSRRMDSAWTVMSAVMAPDSIEARRSGLGSGYDAIVDAVGAIGGHEPQPVAAGIVSLCTHRPVSAAGRQGSIERPG